MTNVNGPSRRAVLASSSILPALALSQSHAVASGREKAGMKLQRLAWAGVRLEIDNIVLFVDATAPAPDDGAPGPELSSQGDRTYALVTHHHDDHCDPVALKPVLGDSGYIVAHEKTARLFNNRGVYVQQVMMHEPVFLSRIAGQFVVRCVPALDGFGTPQVSWVVDGGGRRIIHCGDTSWHGGWWYTARAYGPFDVAILPINGFRQTEGMYRHVEQPMSLTPEQAALAAEILGASTIVPIHFGSKNNPNYVEEADALARLQAATKPRGLRVTALTPGQVISI